MDSDKTWEYKTFLLHLHCICLQNHAFTALIISIQLGNHPQFILSKTFDHVTFLQPFSGLFSLFMAVKITILFLDEILLFLVYFNLIKTYVVGTGFNFLINTKRQFLRFL